MFEWRVSLSACCLHTAWAVLAKAGAVYLLLAVIMPCAGEQALASLAIRAKQGEGGDQRLAGLSCCLSMRQRPATQLMLLL